MAMHFKFSLNIFIVLVGAVLSATLKWLPYLFFPHHCSWSTTGLTRQKKSPCTRVHRHSCSVHTRNQKTSSQCIDSGNRKGHVLVSQRGGASWMAAERHSQETAISCRHCRVIHLEKKKTGDKKEWRKLFYGQQLSGPEERSFKKRSNGKGGLHVVRDFICLVKVSYILIEIYFALNWSAGFPGVATPLFSELVVLLPVQQQQSSLYLITSCGLMVSQEIQTCILGRMFLHCLSETDVLLQKSLFFYCGLYINKLLKVLFGLCVNKHIKFPHNFPSENHCVTKI